ncbi:MAG: hypothetical protein IKC69_00475 [Clostridia bacterium]|nr:hypothetical protein [Clostridia bacterium]
MKTKRFVRPLIYVAVAVLLVVSSVLGTMAFLASSTAVSNTFTVGNVAIQMFESKTDKDGNDMDGDDKTSDGNSYELIPGKNYLKDPTIYVSAGSTPSYLFVKVKNGISTIEKEGDTTIKAQMLKLGWQLVKENAAGEELYLYVGLTGDATNATAGIWDPANTLSFKPVGSAHSESYDVFESFTIKTETQVADYAGAKVTLTAFAIQTEGFTEPKDGLQGYQLAWNAIVGRFPFESGTAFTAA